MSQQHGAAAGDSIDGPMTVVVAVVVAVAVSLV